jgi:hypothetical protein
MIALAQFKLSLGFGFATPQFYEDVHAGRAATYAMIVAIGANPYATVGDLIGTRE